MDWLRDKSGAIILKDDGITPKKILLEENVWPGNYSGDDALILAVVVLMIVGFLSVFLLERLGSKKH